MKYLKMLEQVVAAGIPESPAGKTIGYLLTEVEPGRAVVELEVTERHHNPTGTLHGGIICDIADAAMAYAFVATLADDEIFTTIELKVNFLRPVFKGKLRAEGKIVKKGSTTGLIECNVVDEKGNLVAFATSTGMALKSADGKRAEK